MVESKALSGVVLAAGMGTRSLNSSLPKVLAKVGRETILHSIISNLGKAGITECVIVTYHLSEQIVSWVEENRENYDFPINVVVEDFLGGTKFSLLRGLQECTTSEAIVILGDLFVNLNLGFYLNKWQKKKHPFAFLVTQNDHPMDSDVLEKDFDGNLIFLPKNFVRPPSYRNQVLSGISFLKIRDALRALKYSEKIDFEPALIEGNLGRKKIQAIESIGYVRDTGTPDRLSRTQADLVSNFHQNLCSTSPYSILMDRDSTLCIDPSFGDSESVPATVFADAQSLILHCNNIGIPVFIITNQSRISSGQLDTKNHLNFVRSIEKTLSNNSSFINDYKFCPHSNEKNYFKHAVKCGCRKPEIGLAIQVSETFGITLNNAIVIGDSWRDFDFAKKLNIPFYHVSRSNSCAIATDHSCFPDIVVEKVLGMLNDRL